MTTISIISCVTGEPESLRKTAESIKPHLSGRLNWIIKFSDKSAKGFVEGFKASHIHVYQQADSSLYEAINQSLKLCNSEFYMVLGAGDMLLPEGMEELRARIDSNSLCAPSYHAPVLFAATGAVSMPQPDAIKYFMSCSHPSSLLKVKNSIAINGFNLDYQIASDYDHLSRYAIAFGMGEALNIPPLVSFMGGGLSDVRALEGYIEENLIRIRVWKTPDIRITGDLLNYSAINISNNIRQNFP